MNRYYKPLDQVKEYSIVKILGEGRYGIVYLARNQKDEKCIIKQLKEEMLESTKEKLFYEQEILKNLDNPRFPKFIETFSDNDLQGYVLQYMEGKVFEDLLSHASFVMSREDIYAITDQLLDMITILQQHNVVHRDIRPPNVLLKENKEIVLIDFGLARYIDNKKYVKSMDYWYMADFLIHLYYTSYHAQAHTEEKPWYEELDLSNYERTFLRKLMGIEKGYKHLEQVKEDFEVIKSNHEAKNN